MKDAMRAEYAVAWVLERADICHDEAPAHAASRAVMKRITAIRGCLET
jgi:hypothetical protein